MLLNSSEFRVLAAELEEAIEEDRPHEVTLYFHAQRLCLDEANLGAGELTVGLIAAGTLAGQLAQRLGDDDSIPIEQLTYWKGAAARLAEILTAAVHGHSTDLVSLVSDACVALSTKSNRPH